LDWMSFFMNVRVTLSGKFVSFALEQAILKLERLKRCSLIRQVAVAISHASTKEVNQTAICDRKEDHLPRCFMTASIVLRPTMSM
jgi:hypothetical protein